MVYETTSSRVGVPERNTFSLSLSLSRERERRNPAAWTCNKSAVTTTPAAYPLRPIRYYLPLYLPIHHPTDRPTNNERPRDVQKRIRQIRHHHHHPHTHHTENQCKIHQLHQSGTYLTFLRLTRETYLTLPYLTLPLTFFWIPPKNEKSSSLLHPFIHPSIREDRSRRLQLTISKKKLPEKLYYLLLPEVASLTNQTRQYIA